MITTLEKLARHQVDENDCWRWLGAHNNLGYGNINVNGKTLKAHRVAYTEWVGEIPAGLELDHLCKIRDCINPDHLEPVTRHENMRRSDVWIHNRVKTHCPQNHPYDEANTYVTKMGLRQCRACKQDYKRRVR